MCLKTCENNWRNAAENPDTLQAEYYRRRRIFFLQMMIPKMFEILKKNCKENGEF